MFVPNLLSRSLNMSTVYSLRYCRSKSHHVSCLDRGCLNQWYNNYHVRPSIHPETKEGHNTSVFSSVQGLCLDLQTTYILLSKFLVWNNCGPHYGQHMSWLCFIMFWTRCMCKQFSHYPQFKRLNRWMHVLFIWGPYYVILIAVFYLADHLCCCVNSNVHNLC